MRAALEHAKQLGAHTAIAGCVGIAGSTHIGRHCRIRRAIIDRDVAIPEGSVIGYDTETDRQRFFVTDSGITVVTRDYSLFESPVMVDYFTSE